MKLINKIKKYFGDATIGLFVVHVVIMTVAMTVTLYVEYHFNNKYEKPARNRVENLNNKRLLANVIQRELASIESEYREMYQSTNIKHIEIVKNRIYKYIDNCIEVLTVLKDGGEFNDTLLVNFYDIDEVHTRITYHKEETDTISIEAIDLTPKLYDIKTIVRMTALHLNKIIKKDDQQRSEYYPLILASKQIESLFVRSNEISNKILYDIQVANSIIKEEIKQAREDSFNTLLAFNIIVNGIVILLAIWIANRISRILRTRDAANRTVNTILENLPFGVIIVSKDKRIISINKTGQKIIGREEQDIINKTCNKVICPAENTQCPILDLNQKIDKSEREVINPDGKHIPVIKTVIPIELDGQEVLLEAFTDISEQKEMQKQLIAAKEEVDNINLNLEKIVDDRTKDLQKALFNLSETQAQLLQSDKMAAVGQLSAGIAHEINTPIGFIKSNLSTFSSYARKMIELINQYNTLLEKVKSSNATVEDAQQIEIYKEEIDIEYLEQDTIKIIRDSINGIERVAKIIIDLKEFSHIKKNETEKENINNILETTIDIAWNDLKHKAEIEKDFAELPEIPCYGGQLGQVFLNILINASHAIEDFGKITITTRRDRENVTISISDNGCGIPPEIQDKIFDPFFTTKEVGNGTGLGLNLAYKIIKSHNGTIEVDSIVGNGTTFTIKLPIVQKAQDSSENELHHQSV